MTKLKRMLTVETLSSLCRNGTHSHIAHSFQATDGVFSLSSQDSFQLVIVQQYHCKSCFMWLCSNITAKAALRDCAAISLQKLLYVIVQQYHCKSCFMWLCSNITAKAALRDCAAISLQKLLYVIVQQYHSKSCFMWLCSNITAKAGLHA